MGTNQETTEPLQESLIVLEKIFNKDVLKLVSSFPELTNALNDHLVFTKRLIMEPTLPSLIGSELWRSLVSSAYIQSSKIEHQIGILSVLRHVLEVEGVSALVQSSSEFGSVLSANRNLAASIIEDGRCAQWINKDLWLLLISVKNQELNKTYREDGRCKESTVSPSSPCPASPGFRRKDKALERVNFLHDLALEYMTEGQYKVGIPLCQQALEELKKAKGSEHPDIAKMLTVLALAYRDQRNFKKASNLLNDALVIRTNSFGECHKDVASSLNNLGVLCSMQGKYKDAESFFRRALTIREQIFGKENPEVASQLMNLSFLCRNYGRYGTGVNYCQRALEIYDITVNPDNPSTARKAFELLNRKKYKEAGLLYKQLLTMAEQEVCFQECSQRCGESTGESDRKVVNRTFSSSDDKENDVAKPTKVNRETIARTINSLAELYHCKQKYEAARTLQHSIHEM